MAQPRGLRGSWMEDEGLRAHGWACLNPFPNYPNHAQPSQPCPTSPNHAKRHPTTRKHAQVWPTTAPPCAAIPNHAQLCPTMPKHAQLCPTMTNHAQPGHIFPNVESTTHPFAYVYPCGATLHQPSQPNHAQPCPTMAEAVCSFPTIVHQSQARPTNHIVYGWARCDAWGERRRVLPEMILHVWVRLGMAGHGWVCGHMAGHGWAWLGIVGLVGQTKASQWSLWPDPVPYAYNFNRICMHMVGMITSAYEWWHGV